MPSFDNSLPMILYKALDRVMPAYRELFRKHDLTEQQWRILRVLWENEKISSSELSERTLLSAASLVGIIDRLESKGLLERARSSADRRIIYLAATVEGKQLGEKITPEVEIIDQKLRGAVSDLEWASMEKTLSIVSSRFRIEERRVAMELQD